MIVRHYKRMRPHKTKKEKKSSSDDDESDWVQIAIAAVGLGLSLWDRHKQKESNKDLAANLEKGKASLSNARGDITQGARAELDLTEERRIEQKDILQESTSQDLKNTMADVHDRGSTLAGSYRDTKAMASLDTSVWSGYEKNMVGINRGAQDKNLGTYSNMHSSISDLNRQMSEIDTQIQQLS